MTTLDVTMIPKVLEILKQYGVKVLLTSNYSSYDVSTGKVTNTGTTCDAWITPPSPYNQHFVDNTTVFMTDAHCFMAAAELPVEPKIKDNLVLGGKKFDIVSVGSIYTGEKVCLYELQLR